MTTLLQDIRYAVRQLWNHPGFSLTAIVSLALGIGATVSVFSIIYAVMIRPLPFGDPRASSRRFSSKLARGRYRRPCSFADTLR